MYGCVMRRSAPLIAALAALTLAAPAAATYKPSYQQLKKSRAAWKARAELLANRLSDQKTINADLRTDIKDANHARDLAVLASSDATQKLAAANTMVGTLTTQRDQALSGLPDAIRAVPIPDFVRLVFEPARAVWPCDNLFQGNYFWSYSFDKPDCTS